MLKQHNLFKNQILKALSHNASSTHPATFAPGFIILYNYINELFLNMYICWMYVLYNFFPICHERRLV